jgi:hypothetical protein
MDSLRGIKAAHSLFAAAEARASVVVHRRDAADLGVGGGRRDTALSSEDHPDLVICRGRGWLHESEASPRHIGLQRG